MAMPLFISLNGAMKSNLFSIILCMKKTTNKPQKRILEEISLIIPLFLSKTFL